MVQKCDIRKSVQTCLDRAFSTVPHTGKIKPPNICTCCTLLPIVQLDPILHFGPCRHCRQRRHRHSVSFCVVHQPFLQVLPTNARIHEASQLWICLYSIAQQSVQYYVLDPLRWWNPQTNQPLPGLMRIPWYTCCAVQWMTFLWKKHNPLSLILAYPNHGGSLFTPQAHHNSRLIFVCSYLLVK